MYNNKMNGYAPFRSSGSRMWGMSSSLPSGMSDYAAYPQTASSYPPPNHHYYNDHHTQHPAHQHHHHHQQQPHHHHHNNHQLPQHHPNYHQTMPPAHNPHHYGIPPPSPAPAQDTDFGGSGGGLGSRRMFDMPIGHSLGAVGQHLSASSTSSLTGGVSGGGGSLAHPGASYNGMGGSGGTNLIINYLPQDMTDRELFSLFRTMGPIETCRIMRDFKTNYSFGYAFINFVTEEGAKRAIKCLNGVTVRNKRLKVSYARPAGEEIKETNLYVTNLPKTITEEQMDVIFGKYGLIVQKNILRDKITGKPRGVAFIRFNKREEAQEAIAALNNVIPEGGSQPLTVRVAEEHGKSKAQQLFGSACTSPISMALHQQQHPQLHQHQQHQQQQQQHHQSHGSSMNMLGYPMPPGGGASGHFHHQSNAMHRGRTRHHHNNNNNNNNNSEQSQSNYHPHHHRYASRPY